MVEPADLVSFGFIPEFVVSCQSSRAGLIRVLFRFVGRLPVVATLKELTEGDLLRVMTEPKNALVRQYEALFDVSGVECR